MSGFLGSQASLIADLSLVGLWVLGVVAAGGWIVARRKGFPRHCRLMVWVTFLAWLPILVGMVSSWLGLIRQGGDIFARPATFVPVMHGVAGGLAQMLMTYTVVRMTWRRQWPPRRPLWLMRLSLILWLLSLGGGTGLYLILYG